MVASPLTVNSVWGPASLYRCRISNQPTRISPSNAPRDPATQSHAPSRAHSRRLPYPNRAGFSNKGLPENCQILQNPSNLGTLLKQSGVNSTVRSRQKFRKISMSSSETLECTLRILVVDDNPQYLKLTQHRLHELGVSEVLTASNGREGLDLRKVPMARIWSTLSCVIGTCRKCEVVPGNRTGS